MTRKEDTRDSELSVHGHEVQLQRVHTPYDSFTCKTKVNRFYLFFCFRSKPSPNFNFHMHPPILHTPTNDCRLLEWAARKHSTVRIIRGAVSERDKEKQRAREMRCVERETRPRATDISRTFTSFVWPILWQRLCAWMSFWGFQSRRRQAHKLEDEILKLACLSRHNTASQSSLSSFV